MGPLRTFNTHGKIFLTLRKNWVFGQPIIVLQWHHCEKPLLEHLFLRVYIIFTCLSEIQCQSTAFLSPLPQREPNNRDNSLTPTWNTHSREETAHKLHRRRLQFQCISSRGHSMWRTSSHTHAEEHSAWPHIELDSPRIISLTTPDTSPDVCVFICL